jgi:hypothetical protein
LLPSRQFGHIVLTTSAGIMNHTDARRKKTGGKVLGVRSGPPIPPPPLPTPFSIQKCTLIRTPPHPSAVLLLSKPAFLSSGGLFVWGGGLTFPRV